MLDQEEPARLAEQMGCVCRLLRGHKRRLLIDKLEWDDRALNVTQDKVCQKGYDATWVFFVFGTSRFVDDGIPLVGIACGLPKQHISIVGNPPRQQAAGLRI